MVLKPLPALIQSDLSAIEREHYNHVNFPLNSQGYAEEREETSGNDDQILGRTPRSYEDVQLYHRLVFVVLDLLPLPKTYR